MPNVLTGDFDAVLELSGGTLNRLFATMHQNVADSGKPSSPHVAYWRIGDDRQVPGRGSVATQIGVPPQVELINRLYRPPIGTPRDTLASPRTPLLPVVDMPSSDLTYRSRAVRALVLLHEEHLRRFLATWKQARAASVVLPKTDDAAYESLDTLLHHVLRASRGYMTWMCEVLGLPDLEIQVTPEPEVLSRDPERYLEHVLERWRVPLQDVGDDRLETPEYPSRWQTRYCIDAMLEHAVMHPIRHAFQLEELMKQR